MKIPKLLRSVVWISMLIFVISIVTTMLLGVILQPKVPKAAQWPWPMLVTLILAIVSFVLIFTSFIGSVIVRTVENAGLRRFGQLATAKVLAVRETGERDNNSPVMRVKLQVYPAGGEPFESVAEDVIGYVDVGNVTPGATVSVRYDPRTKEVALEKVKRAKVGDF